MHLQWNFTIQSCTMCSGNGVIQLFLLKLTIFVILSWVLIKIANRSLKSQKTLKARVQKSLQEAGWVCLEHTYYGKSWIATYKKLLQRQIVLVNEDQLTFDDLRKVVIMALLSNVYHIGIYYYQTTPHARKALHMLSKSRKSHGIKLITREFAKC